MSLLEDASLTSGDGTLTSTVAGKALLTLLASMAYSDGNLHESEVAFLAKVIQSDDLDGVRAWIVEQARPLDFEGLARSLPTSADRWKALRFAARMAWKDGRLAEAEHSLLSQLARALSLGPAAVERVLREMQPDTSVSRFTSDRILRAVIDSHWDAVQLASGALVSQDLADVTPPTEVVARVGLEKVEVMALCTAGVSARFQDGAAFLSWSELVTYSRGESIGFALELHTEDGRAYRLVDQRLAGFGIVLDRLLDISGAEKKANVPPPKITAVRGDTE